MLETPQVVKPLTQATIHHHLALTCSRSSEKEMWARWAKEGLMKI